MQDKFAEEIKKELKRRVRNNKPRIVIDILEKVYQQYNDEMSATEFFLLCQQELSEVKKQVTTLKANDKSEANIKLVMGNDYYYKK